MQIRFTAPTEALPFFTNVSVKTKAGWERVVSFPTDGRPKGPAIFPSKEEMIAGVKRAAGRRAAGR